MYVDHGAVCQITKQRENWEINSSATVVINEGDTFTTLGTINLKCHLKSTHSLHVSLIKLHIEAHKAETADIFQAGIFSEYKDLFDEALRELPLVYRMQVDENENPVIWPAYRIPPPWNEYERS